MKKLDNISKSTMCRGTFIVCLAAGVMLIVAGLVVPPMGEIGGSVLTAVG